MWCMRRDVRLVGAPRPSSTPPPACSENTVVMVLAGVAGVRVAQGNPAARQYATSRMSSRVASAAFGRDGLGEADARAHSAKRCFFCFCFFVFFSRAPGSAAFLSMA